MLPSPATAGAAATATPAAVASIPAPGSAATSGSRSVARPGPAPRASVPAPGSLPASSCSSSLVRSILYQSDASAVDVGIIQLLNGRLHVAVRGELDNSLVHSLLVGVGVGHLAGLPHVVLQVLPADSRRQILDDHSVLGPSRRPVLIPGSAAASAAAPASTTPASGLWESVAPVIPLPRLTSGVLDADALSAQLAVVQLVDGVVGVLVVFELDEPVAIFQHQLANSAVTLEESLHVALPGVAGQLADV